MTEQKIYHLCEMCALEYTILFDQGPGGEVSIPQACKKCGHWNNPWIRVNDVYVEDPIPNEVKGGTVLQKKLDAITSKEPSKWLEKAKVREALNFWISYDFNDLKSRPPAYGKYLICRKDGKVHWETWNGQWWAYNGNEIRYWMMIPETPIKKLKRDE